MSEEREMPIDRDAIDALSFEDAKEMINHLKTVPRVKK